MSKITPSIFLPAKSVPTCSNCNKYLSVGPVTISSGKPVCGRCPPAMDCPALFYENLSKYMYFPCINLRYGCDAMLAWETVSFHEKKCQFHPVDCPALECNGKFKREDIFGHFSKKHNELIINGNQFSVNLLQDNSANKLMLLGKKMLIVKLCPAFPYYYFNFSSWYDIESGKSKNDILMKDSEKRQISSIKNIKIVTYKNKRHNTLAMKELGLPWNIWSAGPIILSLRMATESTVDSLLNRNLLSELECPICSNYMKPRIHMCPVGHSICNDCRPKVSKCPQCLVEMKENRNLVLERLTEHITFPCRNEVHGCLISGTLSEIANHEKSCQFEEKEIACYVNYLTPCLWKGSLSKMISHISTTHKTFYLNMKKPLVLDLKQSTAIKGFAEYSGHIFKIQITFDKKAGLNFSVKVISSKKEQTYQYFLNFEDQNENNRFFGLNKFCIVSEPTNDRMDHSLFIKNSLFKPFVKNDVLHVKINIFET